MSKGRIISKPLLTSANIIPAQMNTLLRNMNMNTPNKLLSFLEKHKEQSLRLKNSQKKAKNLANKLRKTERELKKLKGSPKQSRRRTISAPSKLRYSPNIYRSGRFTVKRIARKKQQKQKRPSAPKLGWVNSANLG